MLNYLDHKIISTEIKHIEDEKGGDISPFLMPVVTASAVNNGYVISVDFMTVNLILLVRREFGFKN